MASVGLHVLPGNHRYSIQTFEKKAKVNSEELAVITLWKSGHI